VGNMIRFDIYIYTYLYHHLLTNELISNYLCELLQKFLLPSVLCISMGKSLAQFQKYLCIDINISLLYLVYKWGHRISFLKLLQFRLTIIRNMV
jgi:hypothetical protein